MYKRKKNPGYTKLEEKESLKIWNSKKYNNQTMYENEKKNPSVQVTCG